MVNKNKDDISSYTQLSILIAQDGFSFYLKHQNAEESVALPKVEVDLIEDDEAIHTLKTSLDDIFDTYTFKSVKLSFSNPYFTFVPDDYFDETAVTDYLKYNVELFKRDHVVTDHLSIIGAHQVFIPLMTYHNLVLSYIDEFEFEHYTNSLINFCHPSNSDRVVQEHLSAFVHKEHLEVVAYKNAKFTLCNHFTYDTDVDLVYYILFCVEELGFDQNNMQLDVYHSCKDKSWQTILKDYIIYFNCFEKNLAEFIS